MKKTALLVSLVFALLLLCACGEPDVQIKAADVTPAVTATPSPTPEPAPTPTPTPEPEVLVLEPTEPEASEGQVKSAPQKSYVLNTSSMKFHSPSCSSVKDIKTENRSDFTGTRDEVLAMGYEACKRCNP